MDIRLAIFFVVVHAVLVVTIAQWAVPLYRTRMPRYKMRGELITPQKPQNYCRKGLCPKGTWHIACRTKFWGDNCPKPREGVNMEKNKNTILTQHYILRSRLKSTNIGHLPRSAKLLPELKWNDELSVIAMRVTNYCNNKNVSLCVNTSQFLNVARNSEMITHNDPSKIDEILITIIRKIWWMRINDFNPKYIDSFPGNSTQADRKFANMVNEKNIYIGCGMLIHKIPSTYEIYFTCLYNHKIRPGEPVYKSEAAKKPKGVEGGDEAKPPSSKPTQKKTK